MSASSESARRGRRPRLLRALAACVVLLAVAGYVLAQYLTSHPGPARCTVRAAGDDRSADYELDPEQAANAATITAVAARRDLPARAVTVALATAMQESGLRNIPHGDRDSLGLFQQRPSQGWGTERQISDPVYAAGSFYDHLVAVPGYSKLPLTDAAQRVQHSGFPEAYAKHEPQAVLLTDALTGRRAASLNCTTGPHRGATAPGDPAAVGERLRREFGPGILPAAGGAARGDGGTGGRTAGAGTASGARLRVPARLPARGWELAHWAVAHATALHIDRVAYAGRVWEADRSEEGWRREEAASAGTSATTPGAGPRDAAVTLEVARRR